MYVFAYHIFKDIDECRSFPCSSHGRCENQDTTYVCICDEGFTGMSCEIGEQAVRSHCILHTQSFSPKSTIPFIYVAITFRYR